MFRLRARPISRAYKNIFPTPLNFLQRFVRSNMTAVVRILTTRTVDSSPSILLIDPNGSKTLINCGEGCQRAFVELSQKLASVHRVCLTHLSHDAIGGLPGCILTTADVEKANQVNQITQKAGVGNNTGTKNGRTTVDNGSLSLSGLELIGPNGTRNYVRSLRHFLRRDQFPINIREGKQYQSPVHNTTAAPKSRKKKRKRQEGEEEETPNYFGVQTIPIEYNIPNPNNRRMTKQTVEILSYIFTTPPVAGKFLPDKAKELGIPPGPLYAKLKNGESVTFTDAEGKERTVESSEVVLEPSPAMIVAVLYYPTLEVWNNLQPQVDESLTKSAQENQTKLELVIHMTPNEVLEDPVCREWRQQQNHASHLFLETADSANGIVPFNRKSPSPYVGGCIGAMLRSKVSEQVYKLPDYLQSATEAVEESSIQSTSEENIHTATTLMDFVMLPLSRKGFTELPNETLVDQKSEGMKLLEESGALKVAEESGVATKDGQTTNSSKAELLFTGTGSAIPCKHRNVTGMLLRNDDGHGMALDIGEGTVGQMLRASSIKESAADLLTTIKVAWVSHPHADHHLGLVRLLTDRQAVLDERKEKDPLLVIGPPPIFEYLREYEQIDPRIQSSYDFLDCRQLQNKPNRPNAPMPRVLKENPFLRGPNIEAVQVTHCAYSYAVVVSGTSFGRVAYSGDCRPSPRFAERARDADMLIHEATFETGMEAEATMKQHSTVGEALMVAEDMRAKRLVLTHFSQRYPKIPPLAIIGQGPRNGNARERSADPKLPVIFAFDYMGLTPANLDAASKLTPAMRCLYPEEGDGTLSEEGEPAAMMIPGFFAQNPYSK